jgi:hypothetical protein
MPEVTEVGPRSREMVHESASLEQVVHMHHTNAGASS